MDLSGSVGEEGYVVDFSVVKKAVRGLCKEWDEVTLLPGLSPHVQVRLSACPCLLTILRHVKGALTGEVLVFIGWIAVRAFAAGAWGRPATVIAGAGFGRKCIFISRSRRPGSSYCECLC